ncbi:substrate-binding domain-containing protein [Halomonas sp. YLGW01]|uniref:substrate-binding domain-containing protein n=1 Tax=Halomonas sp. YLGW01 TaxID=2773308 RepID=UPI0017848ECC|nr:substrate-binding domain-containing protein [Halomonas sp. YLGW01]
MARKRRWRGRVPALLVLTGLQPFMVEAHEASHDGPAHGEASSYYLQVDDYLRHHPGQRELMAQLAERVQAAPVPIPNPPERAVRIATVYPGHQASGYWRRSGLALARRLEQLEIPFELKTFFSRPGVEVGLQGQQLAEALAWAPDYLAFTLDVAPHGRMIERILAQHRTRLILQNITTPLKHWQNAPPFLYVGFDHVQGTRLLAERMFEMIDYHGKYLMLYFARGYVSEMRGGTFEAAAAQYPGIEQVGAFFTDGDALKAYRATRHTLADHPDLEMIFASSTDIALGALRALREAGRLDVLINGWGGGKAELAAYRQGELDLTVMRMNDDNGIAMAEAIKLDLMQKANRVPQIFAGQIVLVDDRVSPDALARLQHRAFRLSDPGGDAAPGDTE